MAISNYGELKTVVADYLHRSDLDDQMDNAALMVQNDILEQGRMQDIIGYEQLDETKRNGTDSPSYGPFVVHRGVIEIFYGNVNEIFGSANDSDIRSPVQQSRLATWNEMRESRRVNPRHYTISPDGFSIRFSPNPPTDTEFIVYYYKKEQSFIDDSDTSRLLGTNPQIYIFGMCKYLAIFTQNVELASVYNDLLRSAIDSANESAADSIGDGPVVINGSSAWL